MRRPPILGLALALAAGLTGGILVLRSGAAPEMTQADLDAARVRWSDRGPTSYDIDLQMGGALTDRRHIEVRQGNVTAMTIDDQSASESAWEYWSVEGLFDSLQEELRNAQDPPPSLGVADPSQIVLRASFDSELGYPTRFFRHLMGRQQGTQWEVVAFEARP